MYAVSMNSSQCIRVLKEIHELSDGFRDKNCVMTCRIAALDIPFYPLEYARG